MNAPVMPASSSKAPMIAVALAMLIVGGIAGYVFGNKGSSPVVEQTATPTSSMMPSESVNPSVSPSSSPMSGWKTYSSQAWNFSVSYPTDWTITTSNKPIIYLLPPGSKTAQEGSVSISLSTGTTQPVKPDWFKNYSSIEASQFGGATYAIKNNDTGEIDFWKNGTDVLAQPILKNGVTASVMLQILSTFKFTSATSSSSSTELSLATARALVIERWGDCVHFTQCSKLTVTMTGNLGNTYVTALYEGLHDDSTIAMRKTASVKYTNGSWKLGATEEETWQCAPGRGHQDFSTVPCI